METNTNMMNISQVGEPQPDTQTNLQKPAGFWAFVGLIVLFAVPFAGLISNIVFACGANKNKSITNFARAYLTVTLVGFVLSMAMFTVIGIGVVNAVSGSVNSFVQQYQNGELGLDDLLEMVMPSLGDSLQQGVNDFLQSDQAVEYLEGYLQSQGIEVDVNALKEQFGDDWMEQLGEQLGEQGADIDLDDLNEYLGEQGVDIDADDLGEILGETDREALLEQIGENGGSLITHYSLGEFAAVQ